MNRFFVQINCHFKTDTKFKIPTRTSVLIFVPGALIPIFIPIRDLPLEPDKLKFHLTKGNERSRVWLRYEEITKEMYDIKLDELI